MYILDPQRHNITLFISSVEVFLTDLLRLDKESPGRRLKQPGTVEVGGLRKIPGVAMGSSECASECDRLSELEMSSVSVGTGGHQVPDGKNGLSLAMLVFLDSTGKDAPISEKMFAKYQLPEPASQGRSPQ